MKKRYITAIAVLLLLSMLLSLTACTDDVSSDSSQQTSSDGDGSSEVSNPSSSSDTSDADLEEKDWGNKSINILGYRDDSSAYTTAQIDVAYAHHEDPLVMAFAERNREILNKYGININLVLPFDDNDPIWYLRNDLLSDENEINAVVNSVGGLAPLVADNKLLALNEVGNDYLSLDESWWDSGITEDLTIKGKTFFINGSGLVTDDDAAGIMLFNKSILEEYSVRNIYSLVKKGEWTVDKMYELIGCVPYEQDPKKWGANTEDIWGMVTQNYDIISFMNGANQFTVADKSGKPVLRVAEPENIVMFEKFQRILEDNNVTMADLHGNWDSGIYDEELAMFVNGKALFMPDTLSVLRNASVKEKLADIGIAPMPKADEKQALYNTPMNVYECSAFAIPVSQKGEMLDMTCYALEAIAIHSQELTELYYATLLGEDSDKGSGNGEMLEWILSHKVYDMGVVYNFGDLMYVYSMPTFIGSLDTQFQNNRYKYQAGIDSLLAALSK